MLTRWPVVTGLVIAALVPIVLFWPAKRGSPPPSPPEVAQAPAPVSPAPTARLQVAHSASSLDVSAFPDIVETPIPSASSKAAPEEPRSYVASAGAALKAALAVMVGGPEPVEPPPPSRQPEPTAGFGSSIPSAGIASAAQAPAFDAPALVQFTGLMQDQQILERNDFQAQTLREVKINVWWNVGGPQTQRLELFAPDGSLYRRVSAGFDADALPRTQGRVLVATPLPVGGTWITEYSLYGTWRVDVYLAGQSGPLTTASFVLNP